MKKSLAYEGYKIRCAKFPIHAFIITLITFLMMSGVHTALILWVNTLNITGFTRTTIVISYWVIVSIAFTVITNWQMRKAYEKTMKKMAEATSKVASGDFSVYVPPVHTADKLEYLDIIIMDFNKMVEELGSIETLKTDFFSNVSHEIKTPIAVIQNSAELLNNGNLSEVEKQEYITSIINSSKKLSALITNILKLNKLEKQNIQPVMEAYDICEQLSECALQFENVWEENNIDFEVDIEDRAMIKADGSLLELVWTNLLSNALKFSKPGGKVNFTQTSTETEIIVSVIDTGCGMTKETMKHIFDKFYQGDTSHSMRGNGLGLSLTNRIVEMMGGNIKVYSELGKGSKFVVNIARNLNGEE